MTHKCRSRVCGTRLRSTAAVVGALLLVAPAWSADRPTDATLTAWVRKALASDPRVEADGRISIEIATATSNVDRFAERRAAERVVRRTPGVRRVRNEIVVDPYPYCWGEPAEQDEPVLPDWDPYWDFSDLPCIARREVTRASGRDEPLLKEVRAFHSATLLDNQSRLTDDKSLEHGRFEVRFSGSR